MAQRRRHRPTGPEMTAPVAGTVPPNAPTLINFSPYGTWRTSPMGLAGRDPIFFARLPSETQTFHPASSPSVRTSASAATASRVSVSSASIPQRRARRARIFGVRWSMRFRSPVTTSKRRWRISVGWRATASPPNSCHHWSCGKASIPPNCHGAADRSSPRQPETLNAENKGFGHTSPAVSSLAPRIVYASIRRAQAGADEARAGRCPGAQPDRSRPRRCAAPVILCIYRSTAARKSLATPTNRQRIQSGRSALTARAIRPMASCRSAPDRCARSCRAATCRARTVLARSAARSPVSRRIVISPKSTTGCRHRKSIFRCVPASPSIFGRVERVLHRNGKAVQLGAGYSHH